MASSSRDWSSLPEELWGKIGSHLAADRFSTTKFRSVCRSWRRLIPKFHHSSAPPPTRFSLPLPPLTGLILCAGPVGEAFVDVFVSDSAIHRIEAPSACDRRGWLVKVERFSEEEIRIMDPLTCCLIKDVPIPDSQAFRLSEFRLSEILARSFALRYVDNSSGVAGVNKLVLNTRDPKSAFLIYENGKLAFVRDGDKELSVVDGRIVDYHDITVHRGQHYVVDSWGTVSWIDPVRNLVQFSPPISIGGHKHLVVLAGELCVVDRILEDVPSEKNVPLGSNYRGNRHRRRRRSERYSPRLVEFKVFKLEEEWGRWTEVKSLGENSLVLAHDCSFAVVAADFDGFEANCIYFAEQLDTDQVIQKTGQKGVRVFRLGEGSIEKLEIMPGYSNMNMFSHSQPSPDGTSKVSEDHSRT